MTLEAEIRDQCARTRQAFAAMTTARAADRTRAIARLAEIIASRSAELEAANAKDVAGAEKEGRTAALIDRLRLDEKRIVGLARSVREIAELSDPVGETIERRERPNGLVVERVRAPLGVVAMIYEARPGVTAEAAALCIRASCGAVLKGGSEAHHSNTLLARWVSEALGDAGLPRDLVSLVGVTDREAVKWLVRQSDALDVVIPRGGEGLIRAVEAESRVPVVRHFKGVCHVFLAETAELDTARALVLDAKLSRPAVCNALECLLIDAQAARRLAEPIATALVDGGCEVRACERTRALLGGAIASRVQPAEPSDFGQEFLDRVIAIRVVDGLDGAIEHIARYGSGHTECIVTRDPEQAEAFLSGVDAACVIANASTRFHDGGELGLGAEMGIATSRLHWRGPMGAEALTTMKWVVRGQGQVRGG